MRSTNIYIEARNWYITYGTADVLSWPGTGQTLSASDCSCSVLAHFALCYVFKVLHYTNNNPFQPRYILALAFCNCNVLCIINTLPRNNTMNWYVFESMDVGSQHSCWIVFGNPYVTLPVFGSRLQEGDKSCLSLHARQVIDNMWAAMSKPDLLKQECLLILLCEYRLKFAIKVKLYNYSELQVLLNPTHCMIWHKECKCTMKIQGKQRKQTILSGLVVPICIQKTSCALHHIQQEWLIRTYRLWQWKLNCARRMQSGQKGNDFEKISIRTRMHIQTWKRLHNSVKLPTLSYFYLGL